MLWSWACAPEMPPPAAEAPEVTVQPGVDIAELDAMVDHMVRRRLVLDPGRFVDGAWVGETEPALAIRSQWETSVDPREPALLRIGWNELAVTRACGTVLVPVRADPLTEVVSVPYLGCGVAPDVLPAGDARLDRRERTYADVRALQALDFLPDVPRVDEPDDAPARWITRAEAASACAFLGGRLPTLLEFRLARSGAVATPAGRVATLGDLDRRPTLGTAGHEDLGGNVAEWLAPEGEGAPGRVGGASFLRLEESWAVPETARSDEIGFRCAFDG